MSVVTLKVLSFVRTGIKGNSVNGFENKILVNPSSFSPKNSFLINFQKENIFSYSKPYLCTQMQGRGTGGPIRVPPRSSVTHTSGTDPTFVVHVTVMVAENG